MSDIPPLKVPLFSHQRYGIRFMLDRRRQGHGIGLFDEMGLGKTVELLATYYTVWRTELKSLKTLGTRFLVVSPLNVLDSWKNSLALVNDEFAELAAVFHEDTDFDSFLSKHTSSSMPNGPLLIITTPGKVFSESKKADSKLRKIHFDSMAVDEADDMRGVIKKPRTKKKYASKETKEEKKKESSKRGNKIALAVLSLVRNLTYLLTGTPVNHSTFELASLAFALQHGVASGHGDREQCAQFWAANENNADEISKFCVQYTIRRLKQDVLNLTALREHAVRCDMTPTQEKIHQEICKQLHEIVNDATMSKDDKKNRGAQVFRALTRLRQNCNSPHALKRSTLHELGMEPYVGLETTISSSQRADNDDAKIADIINHSSKLKWLFNFVMDMAKKRPEQRRKIIVFTQYTRMLMLAKRVVNSAYQTAKNHSEARAVIYEGSMTAKQRTKALEDFQSEDNKDNFVILITTKAGGVGLNVQAASIVVLLDSDFNPKTNIQAISRAHRPGQKRDVDAYTLVCKQPYSTDQWILSIIQNKLDKVAPFITGLARHIPLFRKLTAGRDAGRGYSFADVKKFVKLNESHQQQEQNRKERDIQRRAAALAASKAKAKAAQIAQMSFSAKPPVSALQRPALFHKVPPNDTGKKAMAQATNNAISRIASPKFVAKMKTQRNRPGSTVMSRLKQKLNLK